MSRTKPEPPMSRDLLLARAPEGTLRLEQLLKRIAGRGIAGTLLSGAASLAVGCSPHDGTSDTLNPSKAADSDGGSSQPLADAKVAPPSSADGGASDARFDGGELADGALPADAGDNTFGDAAVKWSVACTTELSAQILASSLQTTQSFDYLAVRRSFGTPGSTPDPGSGLWTSDSRFTVMSERGTPCASATTPACSSKIAKNPTNLPGTICVQACSDISVVTTEGDDVESWSGSERLRQLLAPIDSADEIELLLFAANYQFGCNTPIYEVADGYELIGTRETSECAPIIVTGYRLHVATNGVLTVLSEFESSRDTHACIGRVPEGLRSFSVDLHQNVFGDHLAHCAHLEAASVVAFERLAHELRRHDAPQALIEAALSAALDEVRHARVVSLLARAHGGAPSELSVDALPARTLEQIALENATEGCVRETYGALVGAYQAEQASDGAFAQTMLAIAEDEANHAALSHRIHTWIMPQLTHAARERVRTAQALAIQDLRRECAREPAPELRDRAGLPSATLALAFVAELSRELWTGADEIAA